MAKPEQNCDMRLLALLKFVVIISLLATGIVFLLKGLGVDLPLLKYQAAEARNVPAGIILLLVAIGVARFWRIETKSTVTTTEKETVKPDGTRIIEKTVMGGTHSAASVPESPVFDVPRAQVPRSPEKPDA